MKNRLKIWKTQLQIKINELQLEAVKQERSYLVRKRQKYIDMLSIITAVEQPENIDHSQLPDWQQQSVADIKEFEKDTGVTVEIN